MVPLGGSLGWFGCLCPGCGLFSFVILGSLCPGYGRGFGLSFARGVGLGFLVGLPVGLYVESGWMLVVFSVVVVAFSSFPGGKALAIRWCLFWLMPISYVFRGGVVRFSFFSRGL